MEGRTSTVLINSNCSTFHSFILLIYYQKQKAPIKAVCIWRFAKIS